jgi:enoyl-CoA hydratase/carnithine racemase
MKKGAPGAGTITLTLSQDDRGHLTPGSLGDFATALIEAARARPALLVVTGPPGRFGLGLDPVRLRRPHGLGAAYLEPLQQAAGPVLAALDAFPAPTLALIDGPALGASLTLALACDERWATDAPSTRLGFPELAFGLLPVLGGAARLARVVGPVRAIELLTGTRPLDAPRSLRFGLIDRVVPVSGEEAGASSPAEPEAGAVRRRRGAPRRYPQGSTWIDRLIEGSAAGRRGLRRRLWKRLATAVPGEALRNDLLDSVLLSTRSRRPAGTERAIRLAHSAAGRAEAADLLSLFTLREWARREWPEGVERERIGRRVAGAWWCEALLLVLEGARPDALDAEAARLGMGVGPCRRMEQAGGQVVRMAVEERPLEAGPDAAERVPALLARLTGPEGVRFFHRVRGRSRPDPAVYRAVEAVGRSAAPPGGWTAEAYREAGSRLLLAAAAEASRLAAAGMSAWAIDLAAVETMGWTGVGGGPLRRLDERDPDAGVERSETRLRPEPAGPDGRFHPVWPLPFGAEQAR